ncbi:MAG: phosphotransferase [Prolixibacteraceae bacterium]|nr:phosphotransferase [Prolixibacteraceae bacterium]
MEKLTEQKLSDLFEKRFIEPVTSTEMLPPSGSYREYIRLKSMHHRVIGTWNEDEKENSAFVSFSNHLRASGVNVPEIYEYDAKARIYLQEDLGDVTLFSFLTEIRARNGFSPEITEAYRKVVRVLPDIQVTAGKGIDFNFCYPRKAFDRQSMMWDLNYFKYYFLKLAKVSFDEQALEDDYATFCDYLLKAENNFFMMRDFQSRNILIRNDEPWFIDYQGGRRGALQYDLASLLYDAKADIPQQVREELIEDYLDSLARIYPVDRKEFKQYFYGYVLIRMMQAMGAYGFRGFYEKKAHFLKSIPFALENLSVVMKKIDIPILLTELYTVLNSLSESEVLKNIVAKETELTVTITSFSYKKGIPADPSGNGGGFVFDCRALPNPGRLVEYKKKTGKDREVINYLEAYPEVEVFLDPVFNLVDQSVKGYLERKFTHLTVQFGCTGGQHRSVYCAERLAAHLRNNFPVKVVLQHREQGKS